MDNLRVLGRPMNQPSKQLDSFPKPPLVTTVRFTSDELTSFCPVTHQPDFNRITVEYEPDQLCVESKSLKLYFWSFREEPLFGEQLAHQVADDLFEALQPHRIEVTLVQNIRGGLQMTAMATRKKQVPHG